MVNGNPSRQDRKYIRCSTCSRLLGTEINGDLIPTIPKEASCDKCDPFESIYATTQTTDQQLDAPITFSACKAARVAIANFLLRETIPSTEAQGAEDQDQNTDVQRGTKRPRQSSQSDPSRSPKRSRLTMRGKHLRFDDSVFFRDEREYRDKGLYFRGGRRYVAGRHAAPEGWELLDSSGQDLSYGKFHGLKNDGKKGKWFPDPKVVWKDDARKPEYSESPNEEGGKDATQDLEEARFEESETEPASTVGQETEPEDQIQATAAEDEQCEEPEIQLEPATVRETEHTQVEDLRTHATDIEEGATKEPLPETEVDEKIVLPSRPASS